MNISWKKQNSFERGIVWMLLSSTCLSFSFLFLKISLHWFNYYFLLFLRFCVPFLVLVLITTFARQWKGMLTLKGIGLQLARSGCVLVAQYSIAIYISKNSLLNATVLLNASPLFIPLLEWIFLKQRPGKSTILGALLAFFGVLLVLNPDTSLFTMMSAVGLLAALGQSGSQVLYGMKSKSESLLGSLNYLFFFTTLVSLAVYLIMDAQPAPGQVNWVIILWVVLMGSFTVLNQLFRGLAYRCGRPSTLATFLYISVFVSALLDWTIYKKYPTRLALIGSCLIILGGVLKIVLRAHILKKKGHK